MFIQRTLDLRMDLQFCIIVRCSVGKRTSVKNSIKQLYRNIREMFFVGEWVLVDFLYSFLAINI